MRATTGSGDVGLGVSAHAVSRIDCAGKHQSEFQSDLRVTSSPLLIVLQWVTVCLVQSALFRVHVNNVHPSSRMRKGVSA